jgi:outer membrane protein assembly factor BamB
MEKRWLVVLVLLGFLLAACAEVAPVRPTPSVVEGEPDPTSGMFFSANVQRTGVYEGRDLKLPEEPAWQFQTGEWVFTAPAIAGGMVYFGSYDNNLYAVAAADGSEAWRFSTGDIIISSPAVLGERVYFGSHDGNVYALDSGTGQEVWRFETDGAVSASPAVVGGKVIVGSEDGFLYALNAVDGSVAWRADFKSPIIFEAAVADGSVYVASSDGVLGVLELATGKLLWQFDLPLGSTASAGPVIADDAVYVLMTNANLVGVLYAIDIPNQLERWFLELPVETYVSPAVSGKLVFLAGMDGVLRAIETNTGKERWTVEMTEPVFSSPAIAGHSLYIGGWGDQSLYSVDIRNGRVQWQMPLGSGVSSPAVNGDTVYVGTEDGKLNALR